MSRTWIDSETNTNMWEPDCVDEWLWLIWAIGVDYDGCRTEESLKGLIDELIDIANKARECLWENKLFGMFGSPEDEEST
jgi:hypothetical protein